MSIQQSTRSLWLALAIALVGGGVLALGQIAPASAASCIVTSTADSGAGTLRQCILGAGPGDVLTFDPTVFPPGAPATINLTTPLPVMAAGGVTIDAANAGVKVDGDGIGQGNADGIVLASSNNVLYGLHLHAFHGRGIVVQAGANDNQIGGALPGQRNIVDRSGNGAIYILGNGNQVSGNWIGTEDGVTLPGAAGNAGNGVELAAGAQRNIIGGDQPGQGNVIVGSLGNGVAIHQTGTMSNTVAGNYIGLNATGAAILGNDQDGVYISDGATANTVGGAASGARNYITGNKGNGVTLTGADTAHNTVAGNVIGLDVDGTRAIVGETVSLSPNYANDHTLGVGTRGQGLWGSTDGGVTWQQTSTGMAAGERIWSLAYSPAFATDHTAFASGNWGRLYKSTDGGVNWNRMDDAQTDSSVYVVAVSPGYPADPLLFAGVWGGVLISRDGGATWTLHDPRPAPAGEFGVLFIALSPDFASDRTLFVVVTEDNSDYRLYRSTDAGVTWSELPTPWVGYGGMVFNITANGTLLAGLSWAENDCGALFISSNDGATWQEIGAQVDFCGIQALAASPAFSATGPDRTLFVGDQSNGVLRSADGGATWSQVLNLNDARSMATAFAAGGDLVVFTLTRMSGAYRSADGGATWTLLGGLTEPGNAQNGIRIDDNAHDNTVGGATAGARNVIARNGQHGVELTAGAHHNQVSGNYVGVDPSGAVALGNGEFGILAGDGAEDNHIGVVGSTQAQGAAVGGAGNVISGNTMPGIGLCGSRTARNVVAGNLIGADAQGVNALGANGWAGVLICDRATENVVGGAASAERNVISGNAQMGILIEGGVGNFVRGNYIGVDASGAAALGNGSPGIMLLGASTGNIIGGALPGERNVVSGNDGSGLHLSGSGVTTNTILGNYIGLDAAGTADLGNDDDGIWIGGGASANVIGGAVDSGARNYIAGNAGSGVNIRDVGTNFNQLLGNYIGTDVSGAIGLGNDGHGVQVQEGAQDTIIGAGATTRNLISANRDAGIRIESAGTDHTIVRGNYIGVDAAGLTSLGNSEEGIYQRGGAGTQIGGSGAGEGNVVSGNGSDGIRLVGSEVTSNTIVGNIIGLNAAGTAALGNAGNGVHIEDGPSANTIGGVTSSERNLISGNLQVGVVIDGAGTANNVVAGNFVGVNASGSAALGNARFGMLLAAGTAQNRIGGVNATPGSSCTGACNLISGNANTGVSVSQAFSNTFSGNYIGTNLQGTQALPNASGVLLYGGAANNTIGGATPGERNLVSGNRFDGIGFFQSGTTGNTVLGNDVGVVADGTAGLGNNSSGIAIGLSASGNRIGGTAPGEDNVIAYNAVNGVTVEGATTLSNTITHNSIHHNVQLGIDLTNGGNAELAAPVFITVTNSGMVVGTACANCTVEIFSDAGGQGSVFEGSTVANGAGQFTFQATRLLTGPQLTATATDASGNTSEFSSPFALPTQIVRVYLPVVRK